MDFAPLANLNGSRNATFSSSHSGHTKETSPTKRSVTDWTLDCSFLLQEFQQANLSGSGKLNHAGSRGSPPEILPRRIRMTALSSPLVANHLPEPSGSGRVSRPATRPQVGRHAADRGRPEQSLRCSSGVNVLHSTISIPRWLHSSLANRPLPERTYSDGPRLVRQKQDEHLAFRPAKLDTKSARSDRLTLVAGLVILVSTDARICAKTAIR
jgi:hypothetical protein